MTVACITTFAASTRGLAARLTKVKLRAGMIFVRGLETAAAVVIVTFGGLLLTGYMVSERMVGV